jgi:Uma2 family endonuclease
MVTQLSTPQQPTIKYLDSDGQPMSDNTKQFYWIVTIKENLELLFSNDPNVFIAGDLLWYPIEGNNKICQAPDIMVVFGRPKGDRGYYQQWLEDNVTPQIAFEILSPSNRVKDITKKFKFYDRYGIEEYYIYDLEDNELIGWQRINGEFEIIEEMHQWVSPRLGIRFIVQPDTLEIEKPNGDRFLSFVELGHLREQERQQLELTQDQLETTQNQLETTQNQLEQEHQRAEQLAAQLRQLGIEPNQ